VTIRRIPPEDWAESWKRHFKPLEIGGALLVKPSWSKRRARRGQAVIVLDPGLSFGTGHHPTTGFCLSQIARLRRRGLQQSFLDIGTGSGILAIAADKLGYHPTEAFDYDRDAVRIARENARQNRVGAKIFCGDLTMMDTEGKRRFDVICANLEAGTLRAEREKIVTRLKPGGYLIAAGVLAVEFSSVRKTYDESGLKFLRGRTDKEWRSAVFRRLAGVGEGRVTGGRRGR
jgi:ribosomal protein L11 methyltransferase